MALRIDNVREFRVIPQNVRDWAQFFRSFLADALTGSLDASQLADGAVTTDKIADGSVAADKLAAGAVTTVKIPAGAIGTTQLGQDITASGKALLDDASAAAQRTTLGLGTAATASTGTSGTTVPLLDGANTWSGKQTLSLPPILPTYTVGTLPSAATYARGLIYVSDETGGAVVAMSDGTNWRRLTDRAVVA